MDSVNMNSQQTFVNFSQPSENNKDAILEQLRALIVQPGLVLEIGSGSGQHAVYFTENLPHLSWQPTDRGDYYAGLQINIAALAGSNVCAPQPLDVSDEEWPVSDVDYVFSANSVHIMPEGSVEDLITGASKILKPDGLLILYGPYKYGGEFTTESNANFDQWLKRRDPASGIRDIEWVKSLALDAGLIFLKDVSMPANNQFLVFSRG